MDRQLVYPGQIPLDTDLLNAQKNAMIGLAKLAEAVLGTSTLVQGLSCNPTAPTSMTVDVDPGQIYALESIDASAYGALAADTTHQIVKQGVALDKTNLSCPAPGTAGYSINYLIQAAYQDADANSTVLPYYNASNPAQAYSGPNNSGTAQYTVRQGQCVVSAKAGVAANTGSQTTPSPDAGYVGLFVVTVADTDTTLSAGNISQIAGAPFIPHTLRDLSRLAGGSVKTIDANTANKTLTQDDAGLVIVDGSLGAVDVTLEGASVLPALGFIFARSDTSANAVNILAAGSDTINGSASIPLTVGVPVYLISDGATEYRNLLASPEHQIQPVDASVASNALTITLNPTALEFRDSSLNSGAVNKRYVTTPISLTISSGSTLGMADGQLGRIAVLAIDNAGTVELAAVNLAGGVNLDETTLISTTAEGGAGGADSASVIYSTTARSSVPFRVVGVLEVTEAAAGTWATAPSKIQGVGGQAFAAMASIGYGQTWQDVTASRSAGTTYYNLTGKPISVAVSTLNGSDSVGSVRIVVDGITACFQGVSYPGGTSNRPAGDAIVPPGSSYVATVSGVSVDTWAELR